MIQNMSKHNILLGGAIKHDSLCNQVIQHI